MKLILLQLIIKWQKNIEEKPASKTLMQAYYPASSGFSRPDATLRRERNHREH